MKTLGVSVGLNVLQLVVILVSVESRHGTLPRVTRSLAGGAHERLWSGSVHRDHRGALPDLSVLPQRLRNHDVGDGHHRHAEGEVHHVQRHDGFPFSGRQTGHGKAEVGLAGFQGAQGGQSETGGPEKQGEKHGAGKGGRAIGLLPQHHAEPVQGDHGHGLEGHDDEARTGDVEGEAEGIGDAPGGAEEEHEGEHGGGHATDEEVAEGQVQDHEIKVGSELPEGWIKEGQEDDEVAVRAQAEDDRQQKSTGDQSGRVDEVLEVPRDGSAVSSLGARRAQQRAIGSIVQGLRGVHLHTRRPLPSGAGESGPRLTAAPHVTKEARGRKACAQKRTSRDRINVASRVISGFCTNGLEFFSPDAEKAFLLSRPNTEKTQTPQNTFLQLISGFLAQRFAKSKSFKHHLESGLEKADSWAPPFEFLIGGYANVTFRNTAVPHIGDPRT